MKILKNKILKENITVLYRLVAPIKKLMQTEDLAIPIATNDGVPCKGLEDVIWKKNREMIKIYLKKSCNCENQPQTVPVNIKEYSVRITATVKPNFEKSDALPHDWIISNIQTVVLRGNCCPLNEVLEPKKETQAKTDAKPKPEIIPAPKPEMKQAPKPEVKPVLQAESTAESISESEPLSELARAKEKYKEIKEKYRVKEKELVMAKHALMACNDLKEPDKRISCRKQHQKIVDQHEDDLLVIFIEKDKVERELQTLENPTPE